MWPRSHSWLWDRILKSRLLTHQYSKQSIVASVDRSDPSRTPEITGGVVSDGRIDGSGVGVSSGVRIGVGVAITGVGVTIGVGVDKSGVGVAMGSSPSANAGSTFIPNMLIERIAESAEDTTFCFILI